MKDNHKMRFIELGKVLPFEDIDSMKHNPSIIFSKLFNGEDIIKVESCTGLKDKNSKLIYEGDIAKDKYGIVGCVEFIEGSYFAGDFMLHEAKFYTEIEIIGNIHENPELLEG